MIHTVWYNMLLLACTEHTALRLILDVSCSLSPFMHVTYLCRMYWWFSKACCWDLLLWGTSGGVCEWSVGNCVSWFVVDNWCSCGLQTAWILNLWYICCALIHAISQATPIFVLQFAVLFRFCVLHWMQTKKQKTGESCEWGYIFVYMKNFSFFMKRYTYLVVFTGVFIQLYNSPFRQRFWLMLMHPLAKHNSPSSLTMFPALGQNPDWWTVPMTVTLVTAHTPRMLAPAVIPVCLK